MWRWRKPRRRTGAIIAIGTGGVLETFSPAEEPYGKARLQEVGRKARDHSAGEIDAAVQEDLPAFRCSPELTDGLTLVIAKFIG